MSFSLPKNEQPTGREVRYDRQLRLWGESGQINLEKSKICLLNAGVLGSEILKSLVLPGIGNFTVIDHRKVTDADLESNFFVDQSKLGQCRAEAVRDLLLELNPDVSGKFLQKDVESLWENNAEGGHEKLIFDDFDLVIATELSEKSALSLGQYLNDRRVPLILCKTYGLVAYLRLVLPEHHVTEAHPDFLPPNFQLDRPFPVLKKIVDSIDLTTLSHEQHSHVPYLILLLKALEKWLSQSESSGEKFPTTYAEKATLKKILLSMRIPDDNGNFDEDNFREAVSAVGGSIVPSTPLPDSVRRLFADVRCNARRSSTFWTLCRALRRFVQRENGGVLPLRGDLPDMTSQSAAYLSLQNAYFEHAMQQATRVYEIALEMANDLSTSDEDENDEKSEN